MLKLNEIDFLLCVTKYQPTSNLGKLSQETEFDNLIHKQNN